MVRGLALISKSESIGALYPDFATCINLTRLMQGDLNFRAFNGETKIVLVHNRPRSI